MIDTCSRRQVLTLVAASCLGAPTLGSGQGLDGSIKYVVRAYLRANATGGGFTATLWATDRPGFPADPRDPVFFRGYFLSLADSEVRDEFVRMLKAVQAGRARMTIKLDERGKTIQSLQLELAT